jgi:predicted nucleotidyltransferase
MWKGVKVVDAAVVKSVKEYLKALSDAGLKVDFAVIFGSHAQGTPGPLSDIDVLVVSSEFDGNVSRDFVKKIWHIAARTDSRIEPIPCGRSQWSEDNSSAIIEIARTSGEMVTAA